MKKSFWARAFLGILCIVLGFFAGIYWEAAARIFPEAEIICGPGNLPAAYWRLDSSLREFDDVRQLAINVPRVEISNQIREMQSIRRGVEELVVPSCLGELKRLETVYMDRVIDILLGFVGGAESSLVLQGLEGTSEMRAQVEEEMILLRGSTLTPSPTSFELSQVIPVTGTKATSVAVATETPLIIYAHVSHSGGVNLRQGPGVNYTFWTILQPGVEVLVLGASQDHEWLLVQTLDVEPEIGWVFLPLMSLPVEVQTLPLAIQD
ncbi:MAG: SH3 domain-containing protein [Anaerolineales bacterium]|nr:SH3 domain-containing protein [Anaerolineales bacterium]MCW5856007.1 SH3 domain-containing protein [Anaerolineales bacterium]